MISFHLNAQIDAIEAQIEAVSHLLLKPVPDALKPASDQLQERLQALARWMPRAHPAERQDPVLQRRLRAVSERLAGCRQALIRQSALNQQALATLVPAAARQDTYGPGASAGGLGAAGRYASAGRQSGEFRAVRA